MNSASTNYLLCAFACIAFILNCSGQRSRNGDSSYILFGDLVHLWLILFLNSSFSFRERKGAKEIFRNRKARIDPQHTGRCGAWRATKYPPIDPFPTHTAIDFGPSHYFFWNTTNREPMTPVTCPFGAYPFVPIHRAFAFIASAVFWRNLLAGCLTLQ
jgi:hypothetical protein